MIDHGANVNLLGWYVEMVINSNNYTPLHYATQKYGNTLPIVSLLIKKGAIVNAKEMYAFVNNSSRGWTPLHFAANSGKLDVCRFLVQQGADLNAKDE